MIQSTPNCETGAVVLGTVGKVATWRRPKGKGWLPLLTIQVCSDTDENGYTPAESVTLLGREQLLALRMAVDEALKESAE